MATPLPKKKKRHNTHTLSDLKTLGHQLLTSRCHVNNLPLLLTYVSHHAPPQLALEALLSLQSFFTPLLPHLPSSVAASDPKDDPEVIYRTWVRAKFDELVGSLVDICVACESDDTLREVVLDTLMEFVKVGNAGRFHSAIYHRLLQSIVQSSMAIDVLLDFLATKYFKYVDVRYFTYINVAKLAGALDAKDINDDDDHNSQRGRVELSIRKMHHILSHIPPLEGVDKKADFEMWNGLGVFVKEGDHKEHLKGQNGTEKLQKVLSAVSIDKKMKAKFTKAWISFLKLPLPLDVYKEVLVTLHQEVMPHLSNPILLCDFLTRSYDIGGVISVMALSSLFILMTKHGIEYPNFYEKLYGLLSPSIFMAKHRAKFFELLDSCLKSPLLPAYLAAAFTKRLSRLSLSVPPSGALIIIALIHNLLRRHPSINCLVHREGPDKPAEDDSRVGNSGEIENAITINEPGIDYFDNDESNPVKTKAMRSSLWEIDTLRHHYCPHVSRFVLSLENDLTVRSKTTELVISDFSSGSYVTIFRAEIGQRVKQVPPAFYKTTPTSLFSETDFAGWVFNHDQNYESTNFSDTKRRKLDCL